MPQNWTIGEKCKFSKKDGHGNNVYYVSARGEDGEITEDAYVATKKELSSGAVVYADLETNDFGQRLRPAQKERGSSGGAAAPPDATQDSIEAQTCVKAAALERGMSIAAGRDPRPIAALVAEYRAALSSSDNGTQNTAPQEPTPRQDDAIPF